MVHRTATVAGSAAAGSAIVCLVAPAIMAEPVSPEDEQKLDQLASAYEDLATALSGVGDMTDADLVAARVAVDFLLLRDLNAALAGVGKDEMRPDFSKSFMTRCSEAGRTAEAAMERLRRNSCFESDALPAALSLASLMKGPLKKSPALATAAMELLVNNKEMVILMLDEAVDAESSVQVAALVQAALAYGEVLSSFVEETGEDLLEVEQKQDFGQRIENFNIDFAEHKARLSADGYYGCAELRALFERDGKQEP